jgi:hypothetical protein
MLARCVHEKSTSTQEKSMHHHQQTLADLERVQEPDGWLILGGAALTTAAVVLVCAVLFNF